MTDTTFDTGATRSGDAEHLDFTSIPLLGLLGVARTSAEGAAKYGAYNYMLGMPPRDFINHAMRHQVLWLLGDRSEPHLEHAGWNILAASQAVALDPTLSAADLLSPGATVGWEMKKAMEEAAPAKAAARKAAKDAGTDAGWLLRDVPEVRLILGKRGDPTVPAKIPQVDFYANDKTLVEGLREAFAAAGITHKSIDGTEPVQVAEPEPEPVASKQYAEPEPVAAPSVQAAPKLRTLADPDAHYRERQARQAAFRAVRKAADNPSSN